MPYADKEEQKLAQAIHYANNKNKYKESSKKSRDKMNNGPFLTVDLNVDGKDVVINQPIDGLTLTVLDSYAAKIDELQEENVLLNQELDDSYALALNDKVENTIFGWKALNLAQTEESPSRARLYAAAALIFSQLSITD